MQTITAAREAMATRFELVLHGENPVALRAAAEEALQEIERLHRQLSLYSPSSEVSYINAHAAQRPVQVEPGLFRLLQMAQQITVQTNRAFDITIAPLIRCWGFMGGSGSLPSEEQIAEARARVGMEHVILDQKRFTVRFARDGMMIDLGSIGKGHALDVARETLLEAGITSALVHGGTSTVCGIGTPPGAPCWKVGIPRPPGSAPGGAGPDDAAAGAEVPPLAVVELKNEALSVSGVHGKCFKAGDKVYGHVLDPRTGFPAQGALLAAVALESAAETDAFSTALLLAGVHGHSEIARLREGMRTYVLETAPDGSAAIAAQGIRPL